MQFVDELKLTLASGKGGPGHVSFRRESFAPRGGPDGGDGGAGGNVIIRTSIHINSLVDFRGKKKLSAENGNAGENSNMSGAGGQDLVLTVPEGTIVRSLEGQLIVDMTDKTEHLLLEGGRGGKGNAFFKTSVNQAPEYAQPGEVGEEIEVILELKLIADVGIIGFPNAGKSTLISRVSSARPKIADYPFTTLTPNLGVVKVGDYQDFVVADIPGLIPGAHEGVGLGIQFLRHIERTKVFVHLVDISGASGRDPVQDYNDINHELSSYDDANVGKPGFIPLSDRDQILVLNKIDTLPGEQVDRIARRFEKETGVHPYTISGVSGKGIQDLVRTLGNEILKGKEQQ
ncbi:MAG: GTPase ObgE [Pseudobdellovibrionaceae bacterium]